MCIRDSTYCSGHDESSRWLDDLERVIDSSPEDYINGLITRVKELMRECRLDFCVLERAKTAFLAAEDFDEIVDTAEKESWLEKKAVDLASSRFAGAEDCKDIEIVFNYRDSSFLEVNSTSMYREDIRLCCSDDAKYILETPHKKTEDTSDILKELGARYISDDQHVYIYANPDASRGKLREAYMHRTDAVLFAWFSYA